MSCCLDIFLLAFLYFKVRYIYPYYLLAHCGVLNWSVKIAVKSIEFVKRVRSFSGALYFFYHLNAMAPRQLAQSELPIITHATSFKPCRHHLTGCMGVSWRDAVAIKKSHKFCGRALSRKTQWSKGTPQPHKCLRLIVMNKFSLRANSHLCGSKKDKTSTETRGQWAGEI